MSQRPALDFLCWDKHRRRGVPLSATFVSRDRPPAVVIVEVETAAYLSISTCLQMGLTEAAVLKDWEMICVAWARRHLAGSRALTSLESPEAIIARLPKMAKVEVLALLHEAGVQA